MSTDPKPSRFDAFDAGAEGDLFASTFDGADEQVEILGPHLRVSGAVNLRHFSRLADLVNHSQGYLLLRDARLLRRNGDPTNLTMRQLMVNRDEITFIGQGPGTARAAEAPGGSAGDIFDRPSLRMVNRRFVVFTPGHTITGDVLTLEGMSLASFVESPDPRFVAMTNVRARSLADRRVISHFDLLLVNKTQMTAAAQADLAADLAD
jgi:hypothetical protein